MSTISFKQFFRNVFYIMLTLSATPYMLLSTFLSLFMEVPVITLSMEVYLPGYDLMPKHEEEVNENEDENDENDDENDDEDENEENEEDDENDKNEENEDEDEDENEDEENEDEDEDEDENEDEEDENKDENEDETTLDHINVENHDTITNSGDCTPIPRHNSEVTIPDSPIKRRPTDIEDEIVIYSSARILEEDFNNIAAVDFPINTPPPSIDENIDSTQIEDVTGVDDMLKQESSESSSSVDDE